MQYLIYFAVTAPLLLGWLYYEAATLPPSPPLFASGYEHTATAPAQQPVAAPVTTNGTKKFANNDSSATN
jgi:hypothetical protein